MIRNFKYSDEVLLQFASTVSGHLVTDLAAFTAFDPDLNQAKKDTLDATLNKALVEGGDELQVASLGDRTEKVLDEMQNSRALFNQLRYWVIKSFPRRKAIQRQFGIGRFGSVTSSQPRMVEFMHELAETTKQYEQELIAVGTDKDLLEEVDKQASLLMEANQAQEQHKGTRTVDTEDRVERLNQIFDALRSFNNAAEFVFFSEPAKRELYRPPSKSQSVEEEMDEVV